MVEPKEKPIRRRPRLDKDGHPIVEPPRKEDANREDGPAPLERMGRGWVPWRGRPNLDSVVRSILEVRRPGQSTGINFEVRR